MAEDYGTLLEQAYKKIKPIEDKGERFELPAVESHVEGIRTIFSNFLQICDYLRRKPAHLEKFLQRELAAPSKMENDRLILTKKIPSRKIMEKLEFYVGKYIICKECKKPDTELTKQGEFMFIHCLACGAKHSTARI